MRVILVRHGESEANRGGLIGRNASAHLTSDGRAQAVLLGKYLTDELATALKGNNIFVSPSIRTQQTALAALEGAGITATLENLIVRPSIDEIYRGDLEGRPIAELAPYFRDQRDSWSLKTPGEGSECKRDVLNRALTFLNELEEKAQRECKDDIYVFCHYVVIQTLVWHIMGSGGHELDLENTGCTIIKYIDNQVISEPRPPTNWVVNTINRTTHLWANKVENLPMTKVAETNKDGASA